nr:unnamed protein product [Spirometra erinaceieuropaei]
MKAKVQVPGACIGEEEEEEYEEKEGDDEGGKKKKKRKKKKKKKKKKRRRKKGDNGEPVTRVVDLCAAPGSWSQVLSKRLWEPLSEEERKKVKIVAVDLQAMAPIPVTGLHDLDEYVQSHLVLAALTICARILEVGGTFVAKVFRGREAGLLGAQLRCLFSGPVLFAKPSSSRNSSLESFVVCQGFRGDTLLPPSLTSLSTSRLASGDAETSEEPAESLMAWLDGLEEMSSEQRLILPFVACGDLSGYDADACYELDEDYVSLDPVQPPIDPAYLEVCRKARSKAAHDEAATITELMEATKLT